MADSEICLILKEQPETLISFISVFNLKKGMLLTKENVSVDLLHTSALSSPTPALILDRTQSPNLAIDAPITFDIDYNVDNNLYKFLNSRLDGQVILGIYKHTKKLKLNKLVDMLIYKLLKEDLINYK